MYRHHPQRSTACLAGFFRSVATGVLSFCASLAGGAEIPSVAPVGWAAVVVNGQTTTGGGSAPPQRVNTLEELQKLATDQAPRVIEIAGTISTGEKSLEIRSNKTLVGADKQAIIKGGINVRDGQSNIIVRNLSIQGNGQGNKPVDPIAIRGSHHLWFDHLNVWDGSDGNLDLTRGCDYITVSWCKFWYTDAAHTHRLSNLVGGGSTHGATDTGKNNVTYHHNWFAELVDQRMPRLLFGKGHIFNNYYSSAGNSYCIGAGSFASLLIENNCFKDVNRPHVFKDDNHAFITATGNIYDNTTGKNETGTGGNDGPEVTPFLKPPYPYTLDNAEDVPGIVTAGAGPQ